MGAWRPLDWIIDWEKWCLGIIGDGIRGVITVHLAGNEQGGDDDFVRCLRIEKNGR